MVTQIYAPKIVVQFVVDATNKQQIVQQFPNLYIIDSTGQLVTYNSSFTPVPNGTVIGDGGTILAPSMQEFEKLYTRVS